MAIRSDSSPAASKVRSEQAQRLERLRLRLGLTVIEAAELAGVSRFSWARMEKGEANLDGVALARFVLSFNPPLPAEYVVTGGLAGLPPGLARELVQVEAAEREDVAGCTALAPRLSPRGRKRRKSSPHTTIAATPAAD